MKSKIAIQGFEASFHEIVALNYFGKNIETVECATFSKLFEVMKNGEADFAVCAIENTLAGSILPNYAHLRNSKLHIIGEVYLRIEMNLMALPNQKMDSIFEVHSHPMALLQCQKYFEKFPLIQLIESKDTALSAREIQQNKIKNRAAIASKRAANLYNLEIIAADIHDNKRNFTRFLILAKTTDTKYQPKKINKSSISFRAHHTPGSLAKVLSSIGAHGINLTKIQSLPVVGEEWQYYMYADLEFEDVQSYHLMLKEIKSLTKELQILGEYRQGKKIE
ncbi:MAG TPA: prephenate dehydratase [Chitinophagales bacterium]|jgi:prephenate dehydratase|nr:prephenate dehydratase [Chitinophagales bacterium]MBP6154600.1 prephenate dehydratase [Chitinophagales bacterium]HQV77271.1 prephenate dehydratase [Chitinophagales bacterium]HQW78332.1 prephenate dehydratase [Chitinophagales bacterium]HRB19786.1 prephenate dehydratase [Chitinophagales bacterium]